MHVALTATAGNAGRVVAAGFQPDPRTLTAHDEHADLDGRRLDATGRAESGDGPVHLAGTPAARHGLDGRPPGAGGAVHRAARTPADRDGLDDGDEVLVP